MPQINAAGKQIVRMHLLRRSAAAPCRRQDVSATGRFSRVRFAGRDPQMEKRGRPGRRRGSRALCDDQGRRSDRRIQKRGRPREEESRRACHGHPGRRTGARFVSGSQTPEFGARLPREEEGQPRRSAVGPGRRRGLSNMSEPGRREEEAAVPCTIGPGRRRGRRLGLGPCGPEFCVLRPCGPEILRRRGRRRPRRPGARSSNG